MKAGSLFRLGSAWVGGPLVAVQPATLHQRATVRDGLGGTPWRQCALTLAHKIIGSVVSSRLGFALLKAYAFRTPHQHLYDKDSGEMYMGRWRVVDEVEEVGYYDCALEWHEVRQRTLGSKLLEFFTGYSSIRLHHINRKDHDRDLHSHPFDYRTFVCKGYYSEVYEDGVTFSHVENWAEGYERWGHKCKGRGYRMVWRGDTQTGTGSKFHRISDVSSGGVWTLFCMTRNENDWGFMVGHKFVPSRDYFALKGVRSDGKAA